MRMKLCHVVNLGIIARLIHTTCLQQGVTFQVLGTPNSRPCYRSSNQQSCGYVTSVKPLDVPAKAAEFTDGVDNMGTIKGDVFRFETISIQKEGVNPPQYNTFRVAIPVESELPAPEEAKEGHNEANIDESASVTPMRIQQNAVNVRMPFKDFIQRNIPEFERRMGVRLSLKIHNKSLLLMASGERSAEAIEEMLNCCRKSRVYNYYLCLPVRGSEFHQNFDELKEKVKKCLGPGVAYEKRPHVTLALLNLVTDEDVDAVIKGLQSTTLAVSSISADANADGQRKPYSVELSGVKSIKHKGKAAKRSVFMTHAKPEDTLEDIASEFQESVKRTMNQILMTSHKRITRMKTENTCKQKTVGMMTEPEAAAQGIYITKGGNIEITYTDTAVVDPNGSISDGELNQLLAELHAKNMSFNGETLSKKQSKKDVTVKQYKGAAKQEIHTRGQANIAEDKADDETGNVNNIAEDDECVDDEFEEHETSVTNELHVTLLRNKNVEQLNTIPFNCQGQVSCVELRPRGNETCVFNAYTKARLVRFVGNRYDGKDTEEYGVTQIVGSTNPDMPPDLITDPGAPHADGKLERFVFWI